MFRAGCLTVLFSLLVTLPLACFEDPDSGIAPTPDPGRSSDEAADPGSDGSGRAAEPSRLSGAVDPVAPVYDWIVGPKPTGAGANAVLTGDLSCIGDNLPAPPSGLERGFSGQTVYFGTSTAAPGTSVRFIDSKGAEITEAVSDDGGWFEIQYLDAGDAHLSSIMLSQPGFHPVRYFATHPEWSWIDGVRLGVVSQAEADLMELAARLEIQPELGSLHGRVFDCAGEADVAGVRVTIEGSPAKVFYADADYSVSSELNATTEVSQFYAFNLEPGVYQIALWGFAQPGDEEPVVINRVAVAIEPGVLSVVYAYPE